jgi:carboxyl-terminal processing protease
LKELRDDSEVPLTFEGYDEYKAERDLLNEKFQRMEDINTGISPALLLADQDYVQEEKEREERYEKFLKGIKNDIYIAEAFHIIDDMNRMQP